MQRTPRLSVRCSASYSRERVRSCRLHSTWHSAASFARAESGMGRVTKTLGWLVIAVSPGTDYTGSTVDRKESCDGTSKGCCKTWSEAVRARLQRLLKKSGIRMKEVHLQGKCGM